MDSQGKTFLWNLYISGVTVMGSHGQSWAALDSHGKNFLWNLYISGVTVMGSHGQPWTVTEDLPLEPLHFWSDSHDQS